MYPRASSLKGDQGCGYFLASVYDPLAWRKSRFLEDDLVNGRLVTPSNARNSFSIAVPLPLNFADTSTVSSDISARLISLVSTWYTPCFAVRMSSALWNNCFASLVASFLPLAWRSLPVKWSEDLHRQFQALPLQWTLKVVTQCRIRKSPILGYVPTLLSSYRVRGRFLFTIKIPTSLAFTPSSHWPSLPRVSCSLAVEHLD